MKTLHTIWSRIRSLWQRREVKREIDEELQFHIESRTRENIAAGMPPEDAAREARKRFGNVQNVREECRDRKGTSFGETLWQDIRFGLRMLRKNPGFTAVAVLTLALGIGANTAIFSVVNGILVSPLPFLNSQRLAFVETYWNEGDHGSSSGPDYLDWAERNTVFDGLCAFTDCQPNLTGRGNPLALRGQRVTDNFFNVVEPRMALGRGFLPEEGLAGGPKVAILSYSLWRSRFDADPGIIGKAITLDGVASTVVGVSSPRMGFMENLAQIYVPLARDQLSRRDNHFLLVLGRRKPDVTWQQATAQMQQIAGELQKKHPRTNQNKTARIFPLHGFLVSDLRTILLILLGAVSVLLLVACVNVSNLVLARAAARGREFAIRCSLGASRWRIVRQLLTESILLGLAGGLTGVLLAYVGVIFLQRVVVPTTLPSGVPVPGIEQVGINLPVLGFAIGLSLAAGLFFGTFPAWQASRHDPGAALKEAAAAISRGRSRHRTMSGLVVAQIALVLLLLTGAGLLTRSFWRLQQTSPGFNTSRLLALRVVRPDNPANRRVQNRAAFYQQAVEALVALPGVQAAGAVDLRPVASDNSNTGFSYEGMEVQPGQRKPWAEQRSATPGYFRCLQIPVLAGRDFTAQDSADSRDVVIVNQEFVRRYFPSRDPIGRIINFSGSSKTIIGVVGDVKLRSLRSEGFDPFVYQPVAQVCGRDMTLFLRVSGDPRRWADAARKVVWQVDPTQPILELQTMDHYVAESMFVERSCMFLLVLMAGMAMVVGLVGLYAVMASAVNERRNEIGIRMALGAGRKDILRLILGKGLILTAIGLVVGLAGSFAAGRLMTSLLYEVGAWDPATFVLVPLLLFAVAMLACFIPARRAARVNPMEALRCE